MIRLKCEICNSNDFVKIDGMFVCQNCGCKYTDKEAKGLIEQHANPVTQVATNKNPRVISKKIIIISTIVFFVILLSVLLYVISADNPDTNDVQSPNSTETTTETNNIHSTSEEITEIPEEDSQPEVDCRITEISIGIMDGAKDDVTVDVGDSVQLKAYVTPSDATDTLIWSSLDSSIVSVDENGVMQILKKGTTSVTATAPNGVSGKIITRCK